MKLNNKGFAISSVLYMALVLFLILITSLLTMMGGRKNILDKLRNDAFADVNGIPEKGTNTNVELDIAFPTMTDNMIPIVYTPTGLVIKADTTGNTNRNWYNYNQRKWANAILVKETGTQTRKYYQEAAPGTTINTDDILAYFVWIPRYRYTADVSTKKISVIFENKNVSVSNGDAYGTSYFTHPVFNWNIYKWESGKHVKQETKKLDGFWAGKFETSGAMQNSYSSGLTGLTILPGKAAISNQSIKKMFLNSRKMEVKGNIYGFPQTGTNNLKKILSCTTLSYGNNKCSDDTCMTYCGTIENDSNKLDTHVMKNLEWGAVAILSMSQYGTSGNIISGNFGLDCTGGYIDSSCDKMSYLINNNQSTTGNVYGVYDMVGGLREIMMGYLGYIKFKEDGFNNYEISTNYYDYYSAATMTHKGDALNLYNENIANGLGSKQFFTRGGAGNNASTCSITAAGPYYDYNEDTTLGLSDVDKTPNADLGFRISLAIWE